MLKETSTQKTISTPFLSTGFTVTPVLIPEIAIIKLKIPINLRRIFNVIVLELPINKLLKKFFEKFLLSKILYLLDL